MKFANPVSIKRSLLATISNLRAGNWKIFVVPPMLISKSSKPTRGSILPIFVPNPNALPVMKEFAAMAGWNRAKSYYYATISPDFQKTIHL